MVGLINNTSSVSRYWDMIKDISSEEKLSLISLLSNSILSEEYNTAKPKDGWASRFAGVWKDNRSAEEIMNDIRSARTNNTFDIEL